MTHYSFLEKFVNDRPQIKRIAEIGVYKGHLARHLCRKCRHINEYYAIDQWDVVKGKDFGHYEKFDKKHWDELYLRVCKEIPYHRALKVIRMPGVVACKELFPLPKFKEFFDFVYIDSSHHYEETLAEINAWLPLVRKLGIIGGHDYAATRPEHQGVRRAVDEVFGKDRVKEGDDMVWWVEL